MIISKVMTRNPLYVQPDVSVNDARALMRKEKIGRLPVLDKNDMLVGILTEKDIVNASPSAATSFDMYELSYLLSKLKVEKVMTKKVITVDENQVVEEAARIMADNNIGALPVMSGNLMVGIITESDLFRTFIDMFGARHAGVRVVFSLDEKPGQLAKLAHAIAEQNGNIVSMVTSEGDDIAHRRCTCKIGSLSKEQVLEAISPIGIVLEDIR